MTFAHLATPKPKTAAEAYDLWFDGLPDEERGYVLTALRSSMNSAELRIALESDSDNPAPPFGDTAFRSWRRKASA